MDHSTSTLGWYKSSRSGANNDNCVEVANLPGGGRAVRDSKDPGGLILTFGSVEWQTFVHGVKAGELG
ncbi:DUF397 domain-containing protein [Sphaerisporangium sp. NPDC088356]|uniref:DUF397 domain-containing protein n=1 Tax=Sphaerisporangium sp. NPDC088356 TaxID=3154871 RepID=UPI00342FA708